MLSECQIVLIQIRTDILSILIGVQTVYKGYQPTTKVAISKERILFQDHIATEEEECVPHEMANRMSLFYANSTPMLKMLSDTTSQFVSQVRLTIILVIIMRKNLSSGQASWST